MTMDDIDDASVRDHELDALGDDAGGTLANAAFRQGRDLRPDLFGIETVDQLHEAEDSFVGNLVWVCHMPAAPSIAAVLQRSHRRSSRRRRATAASRLDDPPG